MKKVLLGILVVIILIQFFIPEKNISNNTKYPWYSEIAPVSWFLAQHVNEGKEHLNFSEWAAYNNDQQNHILKDLKKELKKQGMPLDSYLWIHKNAKMTNAQYETLLNWVNTIPSV